MKVETASGDLIEATRENDLVLVECPRKSLGVWMDGHSSLEICPICGAQRGTWDNQCNFSSKRKLQTS